MSSPISSAMIPHEAGASEIARRDMQSKLAGLSLNSKMDPAVREKKLREACEGFESIFIQKMWQEMRNTVPRGGLMHSQQEKIWQDMYDQELSKSMASAGGIGLAQMMYEQLSRNLVSATRSSLGSSSGPAFTPTAAPLLPEADAAVAREEAEPNQDRVTLAPAKAPSVYDGAAPQTGAVEGEEAESTLAEKRPEPQAAPQAAQAPAAQPAPVAPLAHIAQPASREGAEAGQRDRGRKHANRHYPTGPDLAQAAFRDAGDKLGPRAIRAPLHPRREKARKAEVAQPQAQPVQAPAPGSPEALRAALDMARAGSPGAALASPLDSSSPLNISSQPAAALTAYTQSVTAMRPQEAITTPVQGAAPGGLNELVNQVKMRNSVRAAQEAAARNHARPVSAEAGAAENAEGAPTVTKVTYSTNIPASGKRAGKKSREAKQAIRMLNVDNVGVNSKAGAGIAAYHEAREATAATEASRAAKNAPLNAGSAAQAPQPVQGAPVSAPSEVAAQANNAASAQAPIAQAAAPLAASQGRSARRVRNIAAEAMGNEESGGVSIKPLTADMAGGGNSGSFAIPPLTARDSRS